MQGDKIAQAATLQKACENRCGHRPQEHTVLNYQQGHVFALAVWVCIGQMVGVYKSGFFFNLLVYIAIFFFFAC
jgi:hypothetical protein